MGYSEVCCQLCGVAFQVGRIRYAGEPLDAACSWAEQGLFPERNFVTKEKIRKNQCAKESGCSNVKTTRRKLIAANADDWLLHEEDDEDSDWIPESDDDYEPLEWDEPGGDGTDSVELDGDDEQEDASTGSFSLEETYEAMVNAQDTDGVLSEKAIHSESAESGNASSDEEVYDHTDLIERMNRFHNFEHLAGPGCTSSAGYNGNRISAEEMMGINTVQCLVRKRQSWKEELSDEEFEAKSKYFLSGLGGYMRVRGGGGVNLIPIRHDLDSELYPDDACFDPEDSDASPIPFHPTCLDIFKRVSRLRLGFFDVDGLAHWRLLECYFRSSVDPRSQSDPAVRRAAGNNWFHQPGDEWLAANPLIVPSLPRILQGAVYDDQASFSTKQSAFPGTRVRATQRLSNTEQEDCFALLPRELIELIISDLCSKDIAALRLSSRAFTHLPISLWRQLLNKEMTWLWEAWDDNLPSPWALVAFSDLNAEHERINKVARELRKLQPLHHEVIKEEMPEIWDQYCIDRPWLLEDVDQCVERALAQCILDLGRTELICTLPQSRTNWYKVYSLIIKHWNDLKGLRNRRRIWNVCEEIAKRITVHREEGKIDD